MPRERTRERVMEKNTKAERIHALRVAISLGYDALEIAMNADDWDSANKIAIRIGENMTELDNLENGYV
jgi:hypothetical protein